MKLSLDAGLAFPAEDMHGVNIVLPDTMYSCENRHKIKGMIVTHGHEDHIGGIVYHLKQFEIRYIWSSFGDSNAGGKLKRRVSAID